MARLTYEILLSEDRETIEKIVVTLVVAYHSDEPIAAEDALTTAEHLAVITTYEISDLGEVERFDIPAEVERFLR